MKGTSLSRLVRGSADPERAGHDPAPVHLGNTTWDGGSHVGDVLGDNAAGGLCVAIRSFLSARLQSSLGSPDLGLQHRKRLNRHELHG